MIHGRELIQNKWQLKNTTKTIGVSSADFSAVEVYWQLGSDSLSDLCRVYHLSEPLYGTEWLP